jgi:hypothetical protein
MAPEVHREQANTFLGSKPSASDPRMETEAHNFVVMSWLVTNQARALM